MGSVVVAIVDDIRGLSFEEFRCVGFYVDSVLESFPWNKKTSNKPRR